MGHKEYTMMGYKVIEFDNLLSQVEYVSPYDIKDSKISHIKKVNKGDTFYGTKTIDETLTKMKFGDDKATAILLDNIKDIDSEAEKNIDIKMDIEGVAFDLGAVVSGEPECCINTGNPAPVKCIKIIVDLGYIWHTTATVINYRSIGIVNLVNTLQAKGYIVEVLVGAFFNSLGYGHLLKIDTENLCVAQLAVATSAGYWRGVCWATMSIVSNKFSWGCDDTCSIEKKKLQELVKDNTFYIGGGYSDKNMESLKNGDEATKYIAELFNKFCEQQTTKG